jgi:hypothetical protein
MLYPWEDTFSYQQAYLLEALQSLKEGTFSKGYLHKRDVLIKARRAGLAIFDGIDADADKVPAAMITIKAPVQHDRKEHKK